MLAGDVVWLRGRHELQPRHCAGKLARCQSIVSKRELSPPVPSKVEVGTVVVPDGRGFMSVPSYSIKAKQTDSYKIALYGCLSGRSS